MLYSGTDGYGAANLYRKCMVSTMKVINKTKTQEVNLNNKFDALRQGFADGYFYGLEYILEDFFQNPPAKTSPPVNTEIDWFGLYE
jgi:hypothetical protein